MSTVIVGATGGIGAAVARRLDDDAFVLSYHDRETAAYLVESGYTHGEVPEVDGGMHFG
jgi:NADP-dependent 3-hydroxy acid dehydrogenase YdfG